MVELSNEIRITYFYFRNTNLFRNLNLLNCMKLDHCGVQI